MAQQRQLLVMACSATKRQDDGKIPALERYDGSPYRVLRNFLRESAWPGSLSVAVLSAKHGLIGGLAQIEGYDVRMTRALADSRKSGTTEILRNWAIRDKGRKYDKVSFLLGKDYRRALDLDDLERDGIRTESIEGGIGTKEGQTIRLLRYWTAHTKYVP